MTATLPLHTRIDGFDVRDNCLCVGGRKLTDIVGTGDPTPMYIYDSALIRARVAQLRAAMPSSLEIHYAIKANPHKEVVSLLSTLVDGLDVASGGELELATATNVPRRAISFAGPGKREREIEAAVTAGVVLNVESPTELARVRDAAIRLARRAQVAVRVNPPFELKGSGMRMAGGAKPFGVDAEQVPALLSQIDQSWADFEGFHIFAGSQNLNAATICEAQTKSLDLALELAQHAPRPPRFVNIGGGFGIPYFPGDQPLDVSTIGAHLGQLIDRLRAHARDCRLVIELGRYLVGEAGIYVCRVVDRKVSRGHTFLVTDGGLHHHLAASGNFGQVLRKNYPILVGNRVRDVELEHVSVVGPLCTPLDLLGDKVTLPRADVGDLIVVMQSGAYGWSASPHGFLSHPVALELLV